MPAARSTATPAPSRSCNALSVNHCTIARNTAAIDSGGIRQDVATLTIANSIVGENIAGSAGNIYIGSALVRVGANLVQSSALDSGATSSGPAFNTANPLLGPLDDWGGPTRTIVLLLGSPARNGAFFSLVSTDQRGFPLFGGSADMGAYEAGTTTIYKVWIHENMPASTAFDAAAHAATFDYTATARPTRTSGSLAPIPATPRATCASRKPRSVAATTSSPSPPSAAASTPSSRALTSRRGP